jgi:23S rRNA-/tRNA-specific pseudouridylate synthase
VPPALSITASLELRDGLESPALLHEEAGWALLYKPPGMGVQPDARGDEDLMTWYRPGSVPVGRLDRPVSGLVLSAFSGAAKSALQTAQQAGEIHKIYRAKLSPDAPDLPPLIEHGWRFEKGSKKMRTETLARQGDLIDLRLLTGRRHQLRVQLAACGAPILGDRRYGGQWAERIHLACIELGLPDGRLFRLDRSVLELLNLAN